MNKLDFNIQAIKSEDKILISKFISDHWGSPISVSKGKTHHTAELPGFISKKDGKIIGLITYIIENNECEIVTLDSLINKLERFRQQDSTP